MLENQDGIVVKLSWDIRNYIQYLNKSCHYKITLHYIEGIAGQSWPHLLVFNYHDCPICCNIKNSSQAWEHCVERQKKVVKKAEEGPYIGTCFAGVTEAVFPLRDVQEKCVGFLCVSGYTLDRAMSRTRACAAAKKYGLSQEKMLEAADNLNDQLPDSKVLSAQIAPLLSMFSILFYLSGTGKQKPIPESDREKLYYDILEYSNKNFRHTDFTLQTVCDCFNISYTYASHLFAQFNELTFSKYIRRMRIETAKQYMEHTMLPIIYISSECGFTDSNYFSNVFRLETGLTPREYRKKYTRVPICSIQVPQHKCTSECQDDCEQDSSKH